MSTRSVENERRLTARLRGLYALCDDTVAPERSLLEKAERCLAGGARTLQLRLKRTPAREAVDVARALASRCKEAGALFVINDRVDWALLTGADGVHLGDEDLLPEDARVLLGPDACVGVTVRSLEDAARARAAGASYCGFGPIFPTSTKLVPAPVVGLARLQSFCAQCVLPVVAIGGIGLSNIAAVAEAGACGAAVVSDLLGAREVEAQARNLNAEFERGALARSLKG